MNANLVIILATLAMAHVGLAQSTAFTYQGRLNHAGSPVTGLYEMNFTLYDSVTNGETIGTPITVAPVPVSNGIFTATLDFGPAAFTGANRWLEISVTLFLSDQPLVLLTPRQHLTPLPYALHAYNAANLMTFADAPLEIKVNGQRALRLEPNTSGHPNVIGGSSNNVVAPGYAGGTIAGGAGNRTIGYYATVGGGRLNTSDGEYSTVAGGSGNRSYGYCAVGGGSGNTAGHEAATVAGGSGNTADADYATVGGGSANLSNGGLSTIGGGSGNISSGTAATVAGGSGNHAIGDAGVIAGGDRNTNNGAYSTMGGGQNNSVEPSIPGKDFVTTVYGISQHITIAGGADNHAAGRAATISGGWANVVRGAGGTIGGGSLNIISLGVDMLPNAFTHSASTIGGGENNTTSNSVSCTIGGGAYNSISGSLGATLSGGFGNTSTGAGTVISGGYFNSATGVYATVIGGNQNTAASYSLAGGRRAKAHHSGAFVWADSDDTDFTSSTNNEFAIRATGGARFVTALDTNGAPAAGVSLASGSGTWSSLSDRNTKENFAPVDPRATLEQVAGLPIAIWNYKSQDRSVRHIGPTAQDFHATFNIGENDRTISTVDADGVALVAIQGLNQKLDQQLVAKDAEIRALRNELAELKQLVKTLAPK